MTDLGNEPMNDDRSHELARSFLDGTLDAAGLEQFRRVLLADSGSLSALVQAAVVDESLVSHFKKVREEAIRKYLLAFVRLDSDSNFAVTQTVNLRIPDAPPPRRWRRSWITGILAASVLLAAAGLYFFVPQDVAMVTQLVDARMSDGQAVHVGTRLREGQRLEVAEGFVELTFDRGTVVAIKGPADFQILTDMRATSRRGRIMVDVGERSTGFTVETPSANIVDWGTKFGVGVQGEETDIVVFDGIVDLHARGSSGGLKQPKRLTQGEALRVSRGGELHRIVSVNDSEFPIPRLGNVVSTSAPVIASVKDNVRDGATNKCYRVIYGGLKEDAQAYVDRSHQWNGVTSAGLPRFLIGADYVMPFNEDKRVHGLQVTVAFARDANVYVFYDGRTPTPKWLAAGFEDTGVEIGLDEGPSMSLPDWTTGVGAGSSIDTRFRVWKRVAKAGESLFLGPRGVEHPSASVTKAMFAVAATASDI
ncbi:MAG: FecR domain-containing protein [Pirellulales bacterium]